MTPQWITSAQQEEQLPVISVIIRERECGASYQDIADGFGIPRKTLMSYIQKARRSVEIPRTKAGGATVPFATAQRVRALHKEGAKICELVERFGFTQSAVHKWVNGKTRLHS